MDDTALFERLYALRDSGAEPATVVAFLVEAGKTQFDIIRILKESFVEVPLGTIIEVGALAGLGENETLSRDKINALLGPWFEKRA